MKPFNRPQIIQALRSFFTLTGDYSAQLEESIGLHVPITNALDETPWLRLAVPVANSNGASAVLAEVGAVVACPGPGTILQIKTIVINNRTAAAGRFQVRMMAASDIGTAGLAAAGNFRDLSNANIGPYASGNVSRPSFLLAGTHTAQVGTNILTIDIPARDSYTLILPGPGIVLFSTDENGVPGLAVWNITANDITDASFYGAEWLAS